MMRLRSSFGLGSAVQYLIVITVFVYALQLLNQPPPLGGGPLAFLDIRARTWIENTFGLLTPPLFPNVLWQLVTYMFLHGGLWHILFNMYALWLFGTVLERVWGFRRFLVYYFFTGVGAGLTTVLVSMVNPEYTHPYCYAFPPPLPVGCFTVSIGASGAIYGLLLAFALYFPNQPLFLFFIPIPIPAKYAVIGLGVLAFVFSITGTLSFIGHLAHLGGLLFGLLYLKGPAWLRRLG